MTQDNKKHGDRSEIFEKKSVPYAVMALALPTVLSQIVTIIYNFADTWFVGRTENPDAVAAISICMPVYIIIAGLANLFGIGGSSVISRALGEKNTDRAEKAFSFSLWTGLVVSALYSVAVLLFARKFAPVIGADANSIDYTVDYLFWSVVIGGVPTFLCTLLSHLIRSVGKSRTAAVGMAIGAALNIGFDPLFMFVLLPKGYEVVGAAVATMLSNVISCIFFIIVIVKMKDSIINLSPKKLKFEKSVCSDVLLTGFPACLSTCLAMVSNMTANALISGYGTDAVAGMGVAKKVNTLAFNINLGMTQGVLPLIGYNYSAKNYKRMKNVIYFAGGITVFLSVSFMFLYRIFSTPVISFFIKESATVKYGSDFLRVIAFAVPLCGLTYSMNTVFQGTGKKVSSLILSVLRKGVLDIPLMYTFGRIFESPIGVVWATPVAEAISVFVALSMFIMFLKKLKTNND